MPKPWNHWFYFRKLTLFDAHKLTLHPKSEAFGSKIAPSATTVTASSPSVANRGAHKTVAGLIFGAQKGQQSLHAYMLACSHAYMTTCLHAYMPTWLHA